jgi:hypothetical protein
VLAAKCALGVRVDALGDVSDEGAVGLEARAKVGGGERRATAGAQGLICLGCLGVTGAEQRW